MKPTKASSYLQGLLSFPFAAFFALLAAFIPGRSAHSMNGQPIVELAANRIEWPELRNRLANGSMPGRYYELLRQLGIRDVDSLMRLDDVRIQRLLLDEYSSDLLLLVGGSSIRSSR